LFPNFIRVIATVLQVCEKKS